MFVINLDRTPERMHQFKQVNPHLAHVTRFSAVDGKTVEHAPLLKQKIFAKPIFFSDEAVGCMLSHLRLWEMAAARNAYTTFFEEDAIVHKDFEALVPALIAELSSDWDVVLWGWNFDAVMSFDIFPGVPCLSRFSQTHMRNKWETIQKNAIRRPSLHRLHYSFGTIAYSISPKGAKKLAALALPIEPSLYKLPGHNIEFENSGLDSHLTFLYDHLNAYACFPPLVLTRNDHDASTVQVKPKRSPFWSIRGIKQSLSIRRIERSLLVTAPAPPDESGFRLIRSPEFPNSKEFTRKYAHYLYKNGDRLGAASKYLKHLFMRK